MAFDGPGGPTDVFRSALYVWQDDAVRGDLAVAAGLAAIHELLEYPEGSVPLLGQVDRGEPAVWSRLAFLRNRRTLDELERLRRAALDRDAIGRMTAMNENEVALPLYDAVGRLKRTVSEQDRPTFRFSGAGVEIESDVMRVEFERWIGEGVAGMAAAAPRGCGGPKILFPLREDLQTSRSWNWRTVGRAGTVDPCA